MILNIPKEKDESMISNLNFKADYAVVGLVGENLAKQYVENIGYEYLCGPDDSELKEYDMLCRYGKHKRKFECKIDVLCKPERPHYNKVTKRMDIIRSTDTGNIFIEFTSWGKDSGIVTTKSDIWLYNFYYLREMWAIKTSELRKLINENTFPIGVGGDPGSDSSGYLIPRNEYVQHFNRTQYDLNIIQYE